MTMERYVAEAASQHGNTPTAHIAASSGTSCVLEDDIATVVDDAAAVTLDDDRDADSVKAEEKPKKVNAFRKRQREELTYLRSKVHDMEVELAALQTKHVKFAENLTPWKILATQLRAEKDRAVQDNEAWRAALQEQIDFGNALHAILKRRPNLSMIPTLGAAQWKMLHMPADSVARRDTATAIVDQQYRLLPSILVSSGLMEHTSDMTSCVPKLWHDNLLVVEGTACRFYSDIDFQLWSQTFWMVLVGDLDQMSAPPTSVLERFGDNMLYMDTPCRIVNLDGQCRDVVKRYMEPARDIFVFRSILHDEHIPLTKEFVANEMAWIVVEPVLGQRGGCSVKFFNKATPPTLQSGVTSPDLAVVEKVMDGLIRHSSQLLRHFEGVMDLLLPRAGVSSTFDLVPFEESS